MLNHILGPLWSVGKYLVYVGCFVALMRGIAFYFKTRRGY